MSPRKEWDDVQNCLSHQERRMGHGKSRPLRNLSKKKGFMVLNNNVKKDYEVVKKLQITNDLKVANVCLGVSVGKACVW